MELLVARAAGELWAGRGHEARRALHRAWAACAEAPPAAVWLLERVGGWYLRSGSVVGARLALA